MYFFECSFVNCWILKSYDLGQKYLLLLQVLYLLVADILHFFAEFLHLQVVLLLQVVRFSFVVLTQHSSLSVELGFERKHVIILREVCLLLLDLEGANVSFEFAVLHAMGIFELLKSDLNVLSQVALLVLVLKKEMLNPD